MIYQYLLFCLLGSRASYQRWRWCVCADEGWGCHKPILFCLSGSRASCQSWLWCVCGSELGRPLRASTPSGTICLCWTGRLRASLPDATTSEWWPRSATCCRANSSTCSLCECSPTSHQPADCHQYVTCRSPDVIVFTHPTVIRHCHRLASRPPTYSPVRPLPSRSLRLIPDSM